MALMIPGMSHQRTWDKDDRELQSFLGLALWEPDGAFQPRFGAGITAPLRKRSIASLYRLSFDPESGSIVDEEEEQTEDALLTNSRLAWHFGHMEWEVGNLKHLLRKAGGTIQVADFDERFFLAAETRAIMEFVARRVGPLSRAALAREHPLYVQSVPARLLDLDLPTNTFFARSLERGLCSLPATLKSAEFYHIAEPELRLMAPQIIWVINYRCSTCTIRTQERFAAALDEWRPFVDPPLLRHLYERTQKSRSYLLNTEVEHLLLPEQGQANRN